MTPLSHWQWIGSRDLSAIAPSHKLRLAFFSCSFSSLAATTPLRSLTQACRVSTRNLNRASDARWAHAIPRLILSIFLRFDSTMLV